MSATLLLLYLGFCLIVLILFYAAYTETLRSKSFRTRQIILNELGAKVTEPTKYKFIGLFHPYW